MTRCLHILVLSSLALQAADSRWIGSKTCATCHAEIYRRYSATPMAQSSGDAASSRVPDQAFETNSGYRYSITHNGSHLLLGFGPNQLELAYFVGSGTAARSYLLNFDNFLYEAPTTYYTQAKSWALSPGYDRYSYPFLTRAIAPGCLQCHATGIQPVAGTQNGYRSPPFLEGGIGCERCHGPGAAHVASGKAADIVNPARLQSRPRDSVCAQCHLSGEIRVDHAGKSMADFIPGANLSDYTTAFVRATSSRAMKVTSHVENLAQSACARAGGNRLWCGTCHDPHFVPTPAEKAAWFRGKCQTCHAPTDCARGDNCIACHMPTTSVTDADHVVYTDHSIPRRPAPRNRRPPPDAPLVPFGGNAVATPRDLGLAYAIVALREHNAVYSAKAFDLLRQAERQNPTDPQTLSYLADLYKTRKDDRTAQQLYQRLYRADTTQSSAPMNLGAYQMEQGHYEQAIALFEEALKISPALVLVRLNLAVALVRTGHGQEARAVLERALEFNPAFTVARDLLNQIRSNP
jgi:cytochrome c-type biogenesis protein CcmH/NrfG